MLIKHSGIRQARKDVIHKIGIIIVVVKKHQQLGWSTLYVAPGVTACVVNEHAQDMNICTGTRLQLMLQNVWDLPS